MNAAKRSPPNMKVGGGGILLLRRRERDRRRPTYQYERHGWWNGLGASLRPAGKATPTPPNFSRE